MSPLQCRTSQPVKSVSLIIYVVGDVLSFFAFSPENLASPSLIVAGLQLLPNCRRVVEGMPTLFCTLLQLLLLASISALTHIRLPSRPFVAGSDFTSSVTQWLTEEAGVRWFVAEKSRERLLLVVADAFFLHLVPSPRNYRDCVAPRYCQTLTDSLVFQDAATSVVHLHEDVWVEKREICQSRLLIKCGRIAKRHFARKTTACRINGLVAREFLLDHHLWGFTRAKYYYGLFTADQTLVAVASFSTRRNVLRDNVPYKSHELIRFCTRRGTSVVGGISKLVQAFVRDVQPDDIITVVDRDWGTGSGWHSLGFVTCHVMPPLVMVVGQDDGVRRYLVGAGLSNSQQESSVDGTTRMGLSTTVLGQLDSSTFREEASLCLYRNGILPVYDSGVERLMMVVKSQATRSNGDAVKADAAATLMLWRKSSTQYATSYYSPNSGISVLLQNAECDARCTIDFPLDSIPERLSVQSWRSASQWTLPVFETHSELDPTATVTVMQLANGWRTVGIAGGKTKSICHGIYRANENGMILASEIGPASYIRSMAAMALALYEIKGGPDAFRVLHLGYGAGSLVRFLSHYLPDSKHVAVELDKGVVNAARRMKLVTSTNTRIICADALLYQRDLMEDPFDCICIDIFDEHNLLPQGFYADEFLEHMFHNILARAGAVVHNFHLGTPSLGKQLCDATASYSSVFDCCHTVPVGSAMSRNEILVAAKLDSLDDTWMSNFNDAASRIQRRLCVPFDCGYRVRG